jgi:CelD/BcsL family acetyltransferase involved in cellulose biosynthesis
MIVVSQAAMTSGAVRTALVPAAAATQIAAQWDALYAADDESHFFLSRAYLTPILRIFGPSCRLLAVWNNDRLVALFPLRFSTTRGDTGFRTRIMMAGSYFWADYNGFLAHPDHEDAAIAALAEAVMALGWSSLRLRNLRISDRRRSAFLAPFEASDVFTVGYEDEFINRGTVNNLECPRLALPDRFDAYLAGLGRSTRQKLRRLLRRLDDGEVTIRMGGSEEDAARVAGLWRLRWQDRKRRSIERLERDARMILTVGLATGVLEVPMLERDGVLVSALANYHDPVRREVLFLLAARDPAFDELPTGLLLHADAIRRAIAAGCRAYDFLRGNEAYKLQLGGVCAPIHFPIVRRRANPMLDAISAPHVLRRLPGMIDDGDLDGAKAAIEQLQAIL